MFTSKKVSKNEPENKKGEGLNDLGLTIRGYTVDCIVKLQTLDSYHRFPCTPYTDVVICWGNKSNQYYFVKVTLDVTGFLYQCEEVNLLKLICLV